MARNSLYPFLAKAALWLLPCIGVWFWGARWFNLPAEILSGWLLHELFPGLVGAVERTATGLDVVTKIHVGNVGGVAVPAGQVATAVAHTNPSFFGLGWPLFGALALAAWGRRNLYKLTVGALVLIPTQAWGISFAILVQLAVTGGSEVNVQAGFTPWQANAILFCAQLGYIVLPVLAPVVAWVALNRELIPILMLEGELQREARRDEGK